MIMEQPPITYTPADLIPALDSCSEIHYTPLTLSLSPQGGSGHSSFHTVTLRTPSPPLGERAG